MEEYTEEQLLKFREIVRANAKFFKNYACRQYYKKNRERVLEQNKANNKKRYVSKKLVKE